MASGAADVCRLAACAAAHPFLSSWPTTRRAIINKICAVPEIHYQTPWSNFVHLGEALTPNPAHILTPPSTTCLMPNCKGILLQPRLQRDAARAVTVLTQDGFQTGWNVSARCARCGKLNYSYFCTHVPKSNFHLGDGPWEVIGAPAMPDVLLVAETVGVHVSLLKKLDARMLRCPFTWDALAAEYRDLHSDTGHDWSDLDKYLMAAWQFYVVLRVRREAADHGIAHPQWIDVRPMAHGPVDSSRQRFGHLMRAHEPCLQKLLAAQFVEQHERICPAADPSLCASIVVIDGGAKVYRSICPCPTDERLHTQWLNRSVCLPCGKKPQQKHRTCAQHAGVQVAPPAQAKVLKRPASALGDPDRACKKRPAGNQCDEPASSKTPMSTADAPVEPLHQARRLRRLRPLFVPDVSQAVPSAVECNTGKEDVKCTWYKSRGLLCAAYPCGIVASIREMFVAESKLQVCALLETLIQESGQRIVHVGYDDACHLWDCLNKARQDGRGTAADALQTVDFFIDAFHLTGHKRPSCQQNFNPATRPWASKQNTQAAEQTWKYLNKHRACLKFCNPESFMLHLLWVCYRRNELTAGGRLVL